MGGLMTAPNEKANASTSNDTCILETVVAMTGLPQAMVQKELGHVLERLGHRAGDSLNLDQLREVMLTYLETIHFDLEEKPSTTPLQ
jgi:hypothetical protein